MPLVVVLAFALGAPSDNSGSTPSPSSLPAISASAPPLAGAQASPCAKVLAQLPVILTGLRPRVVHTLPETPFVVAWGEPPVVLRCGVDRPKALVAGSAVQFISGTGSEGPFYDVTSASDAANTFTTVDRAAYISITIPGKYNSGPLPALSRAIARVLPPVCSTDPATPDLNDLCDRRK